MRPECPSLFMKNLSSENSRIFHARIGAATHWITLDQNMPQFQNKRLIGRQGDSIEIVFTAIASIR